MTEKNSDVSLDEVLESIKKMVIDKEPPVLELTDMISDDGSITKVKKNCIEDSNMSSFLRLIQENSNNRKTHENVAACKQEDSAQFVNRSRNSKEENSVLSDMIKKTINQVLQKWINDNLSVIAKEIIEKEIKNFLYNKSHRHD
jgi:cell pole-organizing protein PopZ